MEEAGCKAGLACNKCHGWMELRYHPQTYGKKKGYVGKNEALEKKLIHRDNSVKSRKNNIECIANKEIEIKELEMGSRPNNKYAIGAPYFKSEREPSEGSKRTKAKTGNVGSEPSCNDSSNDNANRRSEQGLPTTTYISYMNFSDDLNWGFHHEGI